jgi:DNA-binding transcriptional MerR regulator
MKTAYEFKPLISKEPFSADFLKVLQQLTRPMFTQKDTPFSPRMLTYYDSKELLLYGSDKGKKRLFTAEQFFWISILSETAKLGYSLLENLQAIKYKFEHTEVLDGNLDKFNFLQYTLAYIIHNRQQHHL